MLNLNEEDENYDLDQSMSQLLSEIDDISNTSPARSTSRISLSVSALQETVIVNDIDFPAID